MLYEADFLDQLRESARLSEFVGQKVRLEQKGREMIGLCPFHKEKTPSFHVSDAKGSYYCFGCGESGDVFRFLTETYNYSFSDAIEEVARATNTPLPEKQAPTPQQIQRRNRREVLEEINEIAAKWFEKNLHSNKGFYAREYLENRGITPEIITQFRIGFAPGNNLLLKELAKQGIKETDLEEAGLIGKGDDGFYDRFRNRLMFPIFSSRGKVIAFGGRVLDNDALPKYLNSPETPLFSKKKSLYGAHLLRTLPKSQKTVYVVEGYLDVIALYQGGIGVSVAPLGTALTEDQISNLWKYCPEPTLCFDGDAAGQKAADRAAVRVLPLLKPGHSLNFTIMPIGEDPDSLLRSGSKDTLIKLLKSPQTLFDRLGDTHVVSQPAKTPEKQAQVKKDFLALLENIKDLSVLYPYKAAAYDLFTKTFRRSKGRKADQANAAIKGVHTKFDVRKRQRQILFATILNHPRLLDDLEEPFANLELPEHETEWIEFRDAIFSVFCSVEDLDKQALHNHLNNEGYQNILQSVLSHDIYQHAAFAKPSADLDDAREGWQEVWHMLEGNDKLSQQHQAMRDDLLNAMDSDSWSRFSALAQKMAKS